jgi:hypothetical protein
MKLRDHPLMRKINSTNAVVYVTSACAVSSLMSLLIPSKQASVIGIILAALLFVTIGLQMLVYETPFRAARITWRCAGSLFIGLGLVVVWLAFQLWPKLPPAPGNADDVKVYDATPLF